MMTTMMTTSAPTGRRTSAHRWGTSAPQVRRTSCPASLCKPTRWRIKLLYMHHCWTKRPEIHAMCCHIETSVWLILGTVSINSLSIIWAALRLTDEIMKVLDCPVEMKCIYCLIWWFLHSHIYVNVSLLLWVDFPLLTNGLHMIILALVNLKMHSLMHCKPVLPLWTIWGY